MKELLTAFIFLLFFSGCGNTPEVPAKQAEATLPEWISNPNMGGVTGSVGISAPHFKGPTYQRKLAISRALDELAMQQGVQVNLVETREQTAYGKDDVRSSSHLESEQTVKNSQVTAHIKATYTDPKTNTLYVWMVLN